MKISIIICTFNRADLLKEALTSFVDQTAKPNLHEIIVVDNNSTDETQATANSFSNKFPNFNVVFEPKQGLSHARNKGFSEANTDWIVYMDDDAKAHGDLVERIIYVTENYNFDCFGGAYFPWYKYGKPKWFKDEYASFCPQNNTGIIGKTYSHGGIIIFRKQALQAVEGFSTAIGMQGNKISYGEETHIQIKMKKHGYIIGFDPLSRIDHLVNACKLTPLWFIKSAYASGRDSWHILNNQPTLAKVLFIPLSISRRTIKKIYLSTLALFKKNYYLQNWFIDVTSLLATGIGKFIKGLSLLIKSK